MYWKFPLTTEAMNWILHQDLGAESELKINDKIYTNTIDKVWQIVTHPNAHTLLCALSDLLFAALLSQGLRCVHSAQSSCTQFQCRQSEKVDLWWQQFHTRLSITINVCLFATSAHSSQSARSRAQIRTTAHSCGSHSSPRVELLRPLVAPSRCQLREWVTSPTM